jgi:DNA polymerase-3 subunit epsilon
MNDLPPFVCRYLSRFESTWRDETPVANVRFVVLDSETTGLNSRTDRLVSIGAVVVRGGEILLDDSYEALLKVAYNSGSVLVHGITREEALVGMDEPEALEEFLEYLGDGVIVGHHIGFDVEMFNVAYQRHYGFSLLNRFLDTMELTLHLERAGAFDREDEVRDFSLDGLCRRFSVAPHDRHTAPGDAFITAQIFLKLLRLAARHERTTLAAIAERYEAQTDEAR